MKKIKCLRAKGSHLFADADKKTVRNLLPNHIRGNKGLSNEGGSKGKADTRDPSMRSGWEWMSMLADY